MIFFFSKSNFHRVKFNLKNIIICIVIFFFNQSSFVHFVYYSCTFMLKQIEDMYIILLSPVQPDCFFSFYKLLYFYSHRILLYL